MRVNIVEEITRRVGRWVSRLKKGMEYSCFGFDGTVAGRTMTDPLNKPVEF